MATHRSHLSRRAFIGGGAAAVGLLVAGCSGSDDGATTTTTAPPTTSDAVGSTTAAAGASTTTGSLATDGSTVFTPADFGEVDICRALPEQMAGPFPSPELLLRRDIAEDRTGMPLRVGAQVVDARCEPVPDAVLEIWHCDVRGDYSAYLDGENEDDAGPDTTFLRGYQVTDENGIVEFHTIFPGWYTGRAVHIHARVHVDDDVVLTTQWYFDGADVEEIFGDDRYPKGRPDTSNEADMIAADDPAADGTMMTVADDADIGGRRALIRVGLST